MSNFREFYYKRKDILLFNSVFEKWYNKKYWGEIDKDRIKKQQFDWFLKLKKIIECKDYDSLVFAIGNFENNVTRELVSKLIKINIKRVSVDIIKERIKKKMLNIQTNTKHISAGLLQYKINNKGLNVFLGKPGNPIFNKSKNIWVIPKGRVEENESLEECALREFQEEIGRNPEIDKFIDLGRIETNYKFIHIYAFEGTYKFNKSNNFEIEWPVGSGKSRIFCEIEYAKFFPINEAYNIINEKQKIFLDRLIDKLK